MGTFTWARGGEQGGESFALAEALPGRELPERGLLEGVLLAGELLAGELSEERSGGELLRGELPGGEQDLLGGELLNFFQKPTVEELARDFAGGEIAEVGLAEEEGSEEVGVAERELAVKESTRGKVLSDAAFFSVNGGERLSTEGRLS